MEFDSRSFAYSDMSLGPVIILSHGNEWDLAWK